jgi:hypothetical protein
MASLDTLQSYRADWTTRLTYPGAESAAMEFSYSLEWTKDPNAMRVVMNMANSPFAEAVFLGEETWVRSGDKWMLGAAEEARKSFESFHDAFKIDDEMTWVNTETINGINTDHYVYDFESPNGATKIHREVWVANHPGLSKIGVRAFLRLENKSPLGTTISETDAVVKEVNTKIAIKRPQ